MDHGPTGRVHPPERVLVVGGGITGLTVAAGLLDSGIPAVTVREAGPRLGGKIRTSPFGGLAAVDEGADAFLARVPEAVELARELGLGGALTHPTGASAAVWFPTRRGGPLHPIPEGLVLGVPASFAPLVRSRLLSVRGKLRAAAEPLLPRTSTEPDSIGHHVRHRLGDEVHERLVDALVGSIYATDTDRSSLREVPQLAALAERHRSLLVAARAARASAPASDAPLFAAPVGGMTALVAALVERIEARGGHVETGTPVHTLERGTGGWLADGTEFDTVVLATPGRTTAPLLRTASPATAELLGQLDHADVVMVSLVVPGADWPDRLHGRSGYLVPKPVQGLVTAASFGSQKWEHWRLPGGDQILRVSLGRDGLGVDHLDDDAAIAAAVHEVGGHLGIGLAPTATRVTRWTAAFPQYRPHHHRWVAAVEASLPTGLHVAGASYRGIGIPACVRDAQRVVRFLAS